MKIRHIYWSLAVACIIIVGWFALQWEHVPIEAPGASETSHQTPSRTGPDRRNGKGSVPTAVKDSTVMHKNAETTAAAPDEEASKEDASENLTEEERMVDAFDALTDKWFEPSKEGVSMKDVDAFAEQFRKVPKARREECLRRALNLVPDANVMLLVGILMDKSQDKELVALVYNDVLNRDEEVKKPILRQIFKDREHPCWANAAWILDVAGALPDKK